MRCQDSVVCVVQVSQERHVPLTSTTVVMRDAFTEHAPTSYRTSTAAVILDILAGGGLIIGYTGRRWINILAGGGSIIGIV